MSDQAGTNLDEEALCRLLGYYSIDVLSAYRSQPDKYDLQTDNFEGQITLSGPFAEEVSSRGSREADSIDVMFGYRTLEDGDLAVAAFLPDLYRKSPGHVVRWSAFALESPAWAAGHDERFSRWVKRYLEGSWDVENGPRYHLADAIRRINGLTSELVGLPLFKFEASEAPNFPLAQNTHRYQEAHQELYGYLIDGLDKRCIAALAQRAGVSVELSSDRTIKALKKVVAESSCPAFYSALAKTSDERGKSAHGARAPAERFPAFEEFDKDLTAAVAGFAELERSLEATFGVDAGAAAARREARACLPQIERPAEGHYSICRIRQAAGKTIERAEFGYRQSIDGCHESEAITIHFTDGSVLGIDTGSNAYNLAADREGLSPEDFHVNFHLTWVPPPKPPE